MINLSELTAVIVDETNWTPETASDVTRPNLEEGKTRTKTDAMIATKEISKTVVKQELTHAGPGPSFEPNTTMEGASTATSEDTSELNALTKLNDTVTRHPTMSTW